MTGLEDDRLAGIHSSMASLLSSRKPVKVIATVRRVLRVSKAFVGAYCDRYQSKNPEGRADTPPTLGDSQCVERTPRCFGCLFQQQMLRATEVF